eukprot:498438-Lingulodinium_polyedra.AAC.1
MARWRSAIVERYVNEAPLQAATAEFRARAAGRLAEREVARASAEADLRGRCKVAIENVKLAAACRATEVRKVIEQVEVIAQQAALENSFLG